MKIRNGFLAGGLSQLVASPMDLVKIRLQGNPSMKMSLILKDTYHQQGLSGLYKGWQPNVGRAALVNIGELVSYDYGKKYPFFILRLFCSTLLCTPADVVKSNYMNHPEKYKNSIIRCFINTMGFFISGVVPC